MVQAQASCGGMQLQLDARAHMQQLCAQIAHMGMLCRNLDAMAEHFRVFSVDLLGVCPSVIGSQVYLCLL